MPLRPVERPDPLRSSETPRYRVVFADTRAEKSWRILVREPRAEMTECWDHLAFRAPSDLPRRCSRPAGRFRTLGWRQFEVGPKQRVWYVIRGGAVVILAVHSVAPKKATE